jgi:DNA repair exonuclease SbcCD ATPase subunit
MLLTLFAALGAVPVYGAVLRESSDHPAVKIIALLEGLSTKVKEEGQAEAVEYATFQQWCTDLTASKEAAIKTAKEEIDVATATIQALNTDITDLTTEIGKLEKELTKDEAQKAAGITNRENDNADFLLTKAELQDTIKAMEDAIASLEASMGAALIQAQQNAIDLIATYSDGSKKVNAFLQRVEQEPKAAAYDTKGGGVVETLEGLKADFEKKLVETERAEGNSAGAHALADSAKQDEIDAGTLAKDTKTEVKGRKGQELSTAESELQESTEARDTAQTVLDETTAACTTRATEWTERSARREGEMKAMKEAVEILQKVTGVRKPSDKLDVVAYSFLQKSSDPRAKIVNLLRQAAKKSKTHDLTKLADMIAALEKQTPGAGVFDQIKNMIEKMIFHLMSEQTDEDNHKNWCDKELEKTTMMKEDKETKKEELQTTIDSLTATIATLDEDIKTNTEDIAALEKAIAEATDDRHAEKEENTATIKDAEDAQTAVSNAIAVLEDFYKSIGGVPKEAWEFAQVKATKKGKEDPAMPETSFAGDSYSGTEGGTGVIDLLTDVASDFASMEAQARSDETTQQDQYDAWLTGSKVDKAGKEKDSEMKAARKLTLESKLESKQTDFSHNTKELEATDKYLENLQPACVNGDSSYDDRKAARTQEIEALRNAQTILQDAFTATDESASD